MNEPRALTVEDVAERLHVSKSGIYALIRDSEIGFYKVGRKIRFTEEQVSRIHRARRACSAANREARWNCGAR